MCLTVSANQLLPSIAPSSCNLFLSQASTTSSSIKPPSAPFSISHGPSHPWHLLLWDANTCNQHVVQYRLLTLTPSIFTRQHLQFLPGSIFTSHPYTHLQFSQGSTFTFRQAALSLFTRRHLPFPPAPSIFTRQHFLCRAYPVELL